MKIFKNSFLLAALGLLIISAAIYLPLAGKIGYSKDDWYLMYDAHVAGPQFFHTVYNGDRPARAYVLGPAYSLFGDQIIYYHFSGYIFRFLSALALFWVLDLIWPRRRAVNFSAALLFLIYPGFLSQVNPIDYQSQLLSLCLAMISIALTVKANLSTRSALKVLFAALSILLGWAYLGLVEYHMGLEVLRLMFIFILVARQGTVSIKNWVAKIFRIWLPYLIIPVGFMFWRTFLFQVQRKATDITYQFGEWLASPIYKSFVWLISLLQDTLKVTFLAWAVPFYNLMIQLRLRDTLIGLAIAIVVTLFMAFIYSRFSYTEESPQSNFDWKTEMFWVGLISAIGGLLPIMIANRQADFGDYSRYTLASSAGSAMVIAVLLGFFSSARVRTAMLAFLVAVTSITHYANAVNTAQNTSVFNNFWWQVAWRVPQFKDGTTLVASYPGNTGISEDYFVWGPAGLIYSPQKQTANPITIRVPAAVLTPDIVLQIIAGHGHLDFIRRGNASVQDYSNVLVLAESTTDGCVRVIDGNQPDVSSADAQNIMLVAPKSKISNVVLSADSPHPPVDVFGPEPSHGWCYYYEKASLAAQQNDWKTVAQLGDEALGKGLYPADRVEWMPFLRAYVMLGERDRIHPLISIIGADAFLKMQACNDLNKLANSSANTPTGMNTYIQQSFCQ